MRKLLRGSAALLALAVTAGCTEPSGPSDPTWTLSVEVSPGGEVTGGPVDCGGSVNACKMTLSDGTAVELHATAHSGNVFESWSGDCDRFAGSLCSVTMDANKSIVASFGPDICVVMPAVCN